MSAHVVLAAGGTGGHMVPASVLAGELRARGHGVSLLSDARGLRFPGLFEGVETQVVSAATASGGNPLTWLRAGSTVLRGRGEAKAWLRARDARAVVGFGGYPALPGLLGGLALGRATAIHEQNSSLGRVNRLLAGRVSAVATSYAETRGMPAGVRAEMVGNPVRAEVRAAGAAAFVAPGPDEPLHLLVSGGSQGARVLSRVVPAGLTLLDAHTRARLRVVQQCRAEDLSEVERTYAAAGIVAECRTYLDDFPARLAWSHLNIARAGASTMAELTAAGRPAILIPFAAATDDHQTGNARPFVDAGAGMVIAESDATAERVRDAVLALACVPGKLASAAAAARGLGRPDAGARLADLVEALLEGAR